MPQRLLLEGGDIDELLLRVQTEHGPAARIVHAEQKLVGGVAGFFARRRYELAVQVDDEPATSAAAGHSRVSAAAQPRSFEDLLADADGGDEGVSSSSVSRTVATSRSELVAQHGRRLSTESPQFEDLLSSLVARAERSEDVQAVRRTRPCVAVAGSSAPSRVPTSAAVPDGVARSAAETLAALGRLGLPTEQLPQSPSADPRTALLDVLAQLPQPAAGRLWGTTVVVGTADLARRAVDAIVAHTGGTGADPLVASCSAPSAADLAVRASALCTANGAAVVVIETPATRAAARRAGRLISGLGLGTVVAAVDATRDVGATREWLAELGGAGRHVDQLAAFDVAESPTPLALLRLGPDVAWLDGRTATVGTWAAPCLDRLLSDERAD